MALIKCPECGKEISDTAKNCINCGYVLREEAPAPQPTIVNVAAPKKEKSFKNFLVIGITLNLCCLLISTFNAFSEGFSSGNLDDIFIILFTIIAVISFVFSLVLLSRPKYRTRKVILLYLITNLLAGGYTFCFFNAGGCAFMTWIPQFFALLGSYILTFISLFIKDEKQ